MRIGSGLGVGHQRGKGGNAVVAPVATVVASLSSNSVVAGAHPTVSVTLRDAATLLLSGRLVTYSSSNTSVATINSSGVITTLAAGTATFTATSEGISNTTGTLTVTLVPVASVVASLSSGVATTGGTAPSLTVVLRDASNNVLTGRTVTYSSSDTSVATINSSGIISLVAAGTATFTATSGGVSGTTGTLTVSVALAPVASVAASLSASSVIAGSPPTLTVVLRDASSNILSGRTVTYSSSNTAVATINTSGVISTVSAGTVTFTATSEGVSGTTSTLTVQAAVASVVATLSTSSVTVGAQPTVTAVLRDASNNVLTGRTITYSSSNTSVATINSSGVITTLTAGTVTFTATSGSVSGTTGTLTVAVDTTTASVVLAPTTLSLSQASVTTDEPVYAGSGLVISDTMDSYVSTTAMDSAGSGYRVVPRPGIQFTGAAPDTARLVVVTGRNGTGKALQINYPADNATQYPNHFVAQGFTPTSGTATHYFQYYAKINATQPNVQAIKWFEAMHVNLDRVQWSTHDHIPDPGNQLSPTRTYWTFYDQSRDTAGSNHGTQPVGPYFDQLNDNTYHRYTHSYKCNTSGTAGGTTSRDGFVRMWIDGVKVIDVCQANVGVTPPGGQKPWCTQQDVDMIAVNDGIQYVQWGGARSANTGTGSLAVDIDDFTYWTDADAEPTFNAGSQTLVFQDSFDSYNTFSDAVTGGWRAANNTGVQDTTSNAAGSNLIIAGRSGTGKALRLRYYGVDTGAGQEAHAWGKYLSGIDTLAGKPGHTAYFQKWFRINTNGATLDGAALRRIVKVKWLELWGITNASDRAQFNTSYQAQFQMPTISPTADGTGTFWQFYGRAGGTTAGQATQIRGPYAKDGANQWHRATFKYRTNSVNGARDGCAMMWLDGTLIVAVSAQHMNVVVPGNDTGIGAGNPRPYWCTPTDVDNLFTNDGIDHLTLGSIQTDTLWNFDIDYDDITMWRD